MPENYPQTAQGPAVPANEYDLERDAFGITDPNLHRRLANGSISPPTPPPPPPPPPPTPGGPYMVVSEDGYVILSEDGEIILSDGIDEDTLADIAEAVTDIIDENLSEDQEDLGYPADYMLTVAGVNSYRLTRYTVHDEESTDSEIP